MTDLAFHLLPGPFNFLRPETDDVRRLFPEILRLLPEPHSVYLEKEQATPLSCLPVLVTTDLRALDTALQRYLRAEEMVQVAILKRKSFDTRRYNAYWEQYRLLLQQVSENVITSSHGRDYPQVFWLFHSLAVGRVLKESPKRIRRLDLNVGRERGDELKYGVLFKYLDRVFSLLYDLASRISQETDELEDELFPPLLTQMRDNVLVFTEEHISRDLDELLSYFRGYLKLDGRDLRYRLGGLRQWHRAVFSGDRDLRSAMTLLLDVPEDVTPDELLLQTGYLAMISRRSDYQPSRFLDPEQVQVWERLLVKLKEFELMHAYRRLIVMIERRDERLVCAGREAARIGGGQQDLGLAPGTRPLDFMASWVVDPEVSRGGLIYDITDFSATVSRLRLSERKEQDKSFVGIFRFQRRVDQIANDRRLKWEKYLGDGAFYSGRDPRRLLMAAIQMQRHYAQAVDQDGFPFDSGMRIALNFGEYRLLPFGGSKAAGGIRYEVFGHGVVELSRLVSGKTTREIEEIKTSLVAKGYPEQTVNRFFAPLLKENVDLIDRREEQRRFYAYVNRNGTLVNEGIVATARFLEELDRICHFEAFFRIPEEERDYVAVDLGREGESFLIGLRKLGLANLKGLESLAVYEVVDGGEWTVAGAEPLGAERLVSAVDESYTSVIAKS